MSRDSSDKSTFWRSRVFLLSFLRMSDCENFPSQSKRTQSIRDSVQESQMSVLSSATLRDHENDKKPTRPEKKYSTADEFDSGDARDGQNLNAAQAKYTEANRKLKKEKAQVHKLEDQMNFEHLKKLQEIFHEADADGGGGLDMDEFREAMKRSMGAEVDDKELEIIFMKVDTNCDGTVDWDEYLSYMLMEYQEKDTMTSVIKQVPFADKMTEMKSCHRDSVVRIAFLQHLTNRRGNMNVEYDNPGGRFLSLSKEGQLGVYAYHDCELEFQRAITVDSGKESFVGPWLTDLVPLANVGMVAISSTEREITFYDMMSNTKFQKQFQVTGFRDTVLSMDFWFDNDNPNVCTLVAGDATGSVSVIQFEDALNGLFGGFPMKGAVKKISFTNLVDRKVQGVFATTFEDVHSNWVNRVRYYTLAQGSECFISCSSSDNDSMYLGYLRSITYGQHWSGYSRARGSYFKVRKGILTFDYCNEWNVIVTGGFDGIVRTWSPYSSKPGSLVKGHRSPVEHVLIISSAGQVVTIGRDRNIRVIDLRDHLTTQVFGPRDVIRCMPISQPIQATFYHAKTKLLWIASIQVGVFHGRHDGAKDDQSNARSHNGPVTSVLYNHLFNQVVTGGQDSIVSVWDLNTGAKAIQFYTVKGVELTAMTFDPTGRRLITGSRNGAVKIWNFNNGACLKTLEEETLHEVTGIVCLKQKIIVAGWSKVPTVYLDSKDDENESRNWAKVHKEDILCLAQYFQSAHGTAIVASGSYDGDIFIWSVDTGHVLCRLNRLEAFSPLSIEGHKLAPTLRRRANSRNSRRSVCEQTGTSTVELLNINSNTLRRHAVTSPGVKLPRVRSPAGRSPDFEDGVSSAVKNLLRLRTPSPQPRTMKSLRWKDESTIHPSASPRSEMTREEKTRHQVNVVTGADPKNYWEADVSVDKVLFLQNRPHEPQTATLLAAGQMGWVYAWSVHPQGGLLGQFVGTQKDGDTVFSMATDSKNSVLITGDSTGYIKVWDIDRYCIDKRRKDQLKHLGPSHFARDLEEQKVLSARRMMKLNIIPPTLVFYVRAHIGSITDITIISRKKLFLTSCGDGAVRLWTMTGLYIGTFGQKQPWNVRHIPSTNKGPVDVRRVASENTLRIMRTGHSPWKLAKNILNFVTLAAKGAPIDSDSIKGVDVEKVQTMYRDAIAASLVRTDDEIEKNYQQCLESLKTSDVLGKSYKRKHRHRVLPKIEVKTHLSNYHVHSSIPFSPLEETCPIAVPGILQDKWRMQMELASEQEKVRAYRYTLKGQKIPSLTRRKFPRGQDRWGKAGAKVVKIVKILGQTDTD